MEDDRKFTEKEEKGVSSKGGDEGRRRRRNMNRERITDIDMTRTAWLDLHREHSSNSNLIFFPPIFH
jgi:hypothetical protein